MSSAPTITPSPTALPDGSPASTTNPPMVPDDMLYELVDGQIVEKMMGAFETSIASLLTEILGTFARSNGLGQFFSEMLFRIDVARDLRRRPDVAFVSHARWPFNRRAPRGVFWDMVPDLAIEVISESNSAFAVQRKTHEYFDAGVSRVWVIYPEQAEIYVYSSATDILIFGIGQEIDGGDLLPGLRLPVAALFEDGTD